MNTKNALLKQLGFSDDFIEIIDNQKLSKLSPRRSLEIQQSTESKSIDTNKLVVGNGPKPFNPMVDATQYNQNDSTLNLSVTFNKKGQ